SSGVSASFAGDPNFQGSAGNGALTVNKAPLTIKADDKTKVYGAALPGFTVTPTGLVSPDTLASLGGTLSFGTSPTAAASSPVGSSGVTASGPAAANYPGSAANGTLSVNAAPLTIKADDKTKVYGAAL